MFHVMLENVLQSYQTVATDGTRDRDTIFTFSPGARGGWNLGDKQLILGAAVPITFARETDAGILLYLSYELPFTR